MRDLQRPVHLVKVGLSLLLLCLTQCREGSSAKSPGGGGLPAGWSSSDIGAVGRAGSAAVAGSVTTLSGSGADIWGTSDAFQFLNETRSGDLRITARVLDLDHTDSWAKAGVMIRETLDAGSRFAMVVTTPSSGTHLQFRQATGQDAGFYVGPGTAPSVWVRLTRSGDTFSGELSPDGAAWTSLGSQTVPMASAIRVGLCVTAHNNGALAQARFSDVPVELLGSGGQGSLVARCSPLPKGGSTPVTAAVSAPGAAFQWSASAGAISGSGASVTWTAPNQAGIFTITVQVSADGGFQALGQLQVAVSDTMWMWHNPEPRPGFPIGESDEITGLGFLSDVIIQPYAFADTWYPSWGSDDRLYSPFMDGFIFGGVGVSGLSDPPTMGWAILTGNDPGSLLQLASSGSITTEKGSYKYRYGTTNLMHDGVWYYGSYLQSAIQASGLMGPFMGFHVSTDFGSSWTPSPISTSTSFFPGESLGHVRMAAPHIVDFGKNMQHSPDGKIYMVAHGTDEPDPLPRPNNGDPVSWMTGDQINLARVSPGIQNVNDVSKYEFYGGRDGQGNPIWTSNFALMKPIVDANNRTGGATATYIPALGRYLMFVTNSETEDMNIAANFAPHDTFVLEAAHLEGPWKRVAFWRNFGQQAYFVNLMSKFLSADGLQGWMCYSANYTLIGGGGSTVVSDPPNSGYNMDTVRVQLQRPVRSPLQ